MNSKDEAREPVPRDASLDELLRAGQAAFDSGDRASAHELWRTAAVANPYDERVWLAMLKLLTTDDDREVCLENIIAINPLNPDARRELRAIRRKRRVREGESSSTNTQLPVVPSAQLVPVKKSRRRMPRSLMIGLAVGLGLVALAVVISLGYGGVLARVVP